MNPPTRGDHRLGTGRLGPGPGLARQTVAVSVSSVTGQKQVHADSFARDFVVVLPAAAFMRWTACPNGTGRHSGVREGGRWNGAAVRPWSGGSRRAGLGSQAAAPARILRTARRGHCRSPWSPGTTDPLVLVAQGSKSASEAPGMADGSSGPCSGRGLQSAGEAGVVAPTAVSALLTNTCRQCSPSHDQAGSPVLSAQLPVQGQCGGAGTGSRG